MNQFMEERQALLKEARTATQCSQLSLAWRSTPPD